MSRAPRGVEPRHVRGLRGLHGGEAHLRRLLALSRRQLVRLKAAGWRPQTAGLSDSVYVQTYAYHKESEYHLIMIITVTQVRDQLL